MAPLGPTLCKRRDRSTCSWAPGCPPWPRPACEGPLGSSLSERVCPSLPQACQWRDVFRAASCCACKARRAPSSPCSCFPSAPTTAGRGPQAQKPLAPPEPEDGAVALRPGGKPHLLTLLRGCAPNRRPPGTQAPLVHRPSNRDMRVFTFCAVAVSLSYNLKLVSAFALEGFPGGSDGNEPACNAGDPGLIPGWERVAGERERLPTPVFSPGKSHRQRRLAGYSPWGHKGSCPRLSD